MGFRPRTTTENTTFSAEINTENHNISAENREFLAENNHRKPMISAENEK